MGRITNPSVISSIDSLKAAFDESLNNVWSELNLQSYELIMFHTLIELDKDFDKAMKAGNILNYEISSEEDEFGSIVIIPYFLPVSTPKNIKLRGYQSILKQE